MMVDASLNRNASPSYFGWRFQIAAAIVLTLRYIRGVECILVENDEDIELEMLDGGRVYAQAKAHFEANKPGEGSSQRLKDALKTLNDSFGSPACRELVYITNDSSPFGKRASDLSFGRNTLLGYSELGEKQQKAITRILDECSYDSRLTDKLSVCSIWYYGSDERTRCEEVDRCIRGFLDQLGLDAVSRPSEGRLRKDWELTLGFGASIDYRDKEAKKVRKSAFVWPVVVESCVGSSVSTECPDLDEDQLEELDSIYASAIGAQVDRFDVVSRVMTDYSEYAKASGESMRQMRSNFLDARWGDYVCLLGADAIDDDEVREAFVRVVVSKVIKKRATIKRVKDAVNLLD